MYRLNSLAALLLASFILSHARQIVFISKNGEHSYLPSSAEPDVCMSRQCVIEASDILTRLDETVDPCDDFHRFACGGWEKRQEVSEDEPEVHALFETEKNLNRKLKELLERKYESSEPPSAKMLKDFYNTCVDLDNIKKKGSDPLNSMLTRLGGWPLLEGKEWDDSAFDWVDSLISFRKLGYDHNILMNLGFKEKNETINIINLFCPYNLLPYGSNLTLGLSDDKISAYFKAMIKAATLLGANETTAEKELLEVVHHLIVLENSTKTQEETEEELYVESEHIYLTVKELQEKVPQIPWLKYLNGILNDAVYENDILDVECSMDFFIKLADFVTNTEKRVIANYMMMRAVLESAEFLSEEWINIYQELEKLNGKMLDGPMPRWKMCLGSLRSGMYKPLSSYYVRNYFKEESKDEAMILTKYINKEFLKILEENDWMDEKTRKKAEEKAKALKLYIGYPDELLNDTFVMNMYENLTITTDNHFENSLNLRKLSMDRSLSDFRKSREETTNIKFRFIVQVNAFYDPVENSIGIPAGILHGFFYEKERPNYLNFGAIGYTIGHEITHGFDRQGSQYDKDGKKVNWWDKESDEIFLKKVQCLIDQYNNYTMDIGFKVNGRWTLNENVADNAGLKVAYSAYQSWTRDHGIEPLLPALNYTQNQLFWLRAAHNLCSKTHPKLLKEQLLLETHSPGRYRIIGPMSNLEEFSNDFKCSEDSPMNRKYKCKVW